jgi:glycosyltransferase involved in cell wall biosynthesis
MIAFVVNGDESSAMAQRATALGARLAGSWNIQLAYRGPGRLASVASLTTWLWRQRAEAAWVFDMALAGVVAGAVGRLRGTRLIVDTGDAITALARQSRLRGPAGLAATALLERTADRLADAIVVRGSAHARLYAERGRDATVIPDGVDVDQFVAPHDGRERRASLDAGDALVVGVLGSVVWNPSLGLTYGWDLVEALAELRDAAIVGVVIGDGSGVPHLTARAGALGVADRLRFVGRQPYQSLPGWLAACDVCLSTQTNDIVGQVRTTGKLPLYMASGRYVLASRVGEAARVLPSEMLLDYEGSVDRSYPSRLSAALRALAGDRSRLARGRDLVDAARREFSYDALGIRVDEVLRQVLGDPVLSRAERAPR